MKPTLGVMDRPRRMTALPLNSERQERSTLPVDGYASESPDPVSPHSTSGGRWELREEGELCPPLSLVELRESSRAWNYFPLEFKSGIGNGTEPLPQQARLPADHQRR